MTYYANPRKSSGNECLCSDPTAFVVERTIVVRSIALALFISFFIFVAGYFLGKRHAMQKFVSKIGQEAFADQIQVALNKFFDASKSPNDITDITESEPQEPVATEAVPLLTTQPNQVITPVVMTEQEKNSSIKYQGQLLGGSQKIVRAFADRMARKGVTIEVKKRIGKTTRGKNIVWYQAVTPVFSNKADLDMLIASIQKTEKIDDINIVELV